MVKRLVLTPASKWRTAQQIRGVRAMLKRDLNACADGAAVQIDLKTARNLIEVCDQAIHTETEHEPKLGEAS